MCQYESATKEDKDIVDGLFSSHIIEFLKKDKICPNAMLIMLKDQAKYAEIAVKIYNADKALKPIN